MGGPRWPAMRQAFRVARRGLSYWWRATAFRILSMKAQVPTT